MQSKSAELQDQINDIDRKIQEGVNLSSRNQLEADRNNLNEQLQAALFEESQQNLQERVEQAKVTGYIADTLTANGIPLIELSHTPENYELTAIAFQKWALEQQDAFKAELKGLEQTLEQTTELLRLSYAENDRKDATNFQQDLEIKDLEKRLKNTATIIEEKDAEIKALKDQQVNAQAVEVAPLSAEEQETKLVADLMGNRLKVTNIRFKDESGLDRRKVLANNALTQEEIEEYAIYSKTRWEEISEEAAQQLRDEYTSKKAEIELSIPVLETPAIPFVNEDTRQDEATTDKAPNETDQVDAAGHELVESPSSNQGQVGEAESEVITLESLQAQVNTLKAQVKVLCDVSIVDVEEAIKAVA